MTNDIKMVLHCGEKTIEVDERTLYDTGALRALATHFHKSGENRFWRDVFSSLADLAHSKSCDDAIETDQFCEHVQMLAAGWDPHSVASQRAAAAALRRKHDQAERAMHEAVSREEEG